MGEPGREFLDRAQAAVGDDGRLPLGPMVGWEVFPFEADGLRARPLTAYAVPEPGRRVANVVSRSHELTDDLDDAGHAELDARADRVRAALAAR